VGGAAAATSAAVVVFSPAFPLLVFAAIVIAVFLRGLTDALARRTGLREGVALAIVVLGLLVLGAGLAVTAAPSVAEDLADLQEELPQLASSVRERIQSAPYGRTLLDSAGEWAEEGGAAEVGAQVAGALWGIAITSILLFIVGIYLAAAPEVYMGGVLRLVPPARRPGAAEVLHGSDATLRRFLLGRAVSMAVVGILTGIAMWIVGVRLAIPLAVTAGLLTFVPYAGPIAAAIPIAVVASIDGGSTLAVAIVAYTAIQGIEGFLVTPLVQQRMVSLPPALTLAAEVAMGFLAGPLGVILSVPLAAVLLYVVRAVYVEPLESRAPKAQVER
jgi:predicted PurR-regulated permease PerM